MLTAASPLRKVLLNTYLMMTDVVEGLQVFGSVRDHAGQRCKIGSWPGAGSGQSRELKSG